MKMQFENYERAIAHYGAVIVSAVFEIFFFSNLFNSNIAGVIALVAEIGKDFLLRFLKQNRKAQIVVWLTYILLVAASLGATTFYSIALTYSNSSVNNAQSLATFEQTLSNVTQGFLNNAQSSADNANALQSNWISAKNGALDDSDSRLNAALELAQMQYELQTNAANEPNPIIAFQVVADKAGVATDTLIIILMVIVGIMLELLIYSTEPWGDKTASETVEIDDSLAGYIKAMFETPTNRKGLPSDTLISNYSGIDIETCKAHRETLKERGWIETNKASRTTEAKISIEEMLSKI